MDEDLDEGTARRQAQADSDDLDNRLALARLELIEEIEGRSTAYDPKRQQTFGLQTAFREVAAEVRERAKVVTP